MVSDIIFTTVLTCKFPYGYCICTYYFKTFWSSCTFWESEGRSQHMLNWTKNIKFIPENLRILQHSSHIFINPHERKLNWSHIHFIPCPTHVPSPPYKMMTIGYRVVLWLHPKQRLSKTEWGKVCIPESSQLQTREIDSINHLECQVLEGEGSS